MTSFEQERASLVERLQDRETLDERTVQAMKAIPRHEFVPPDRRDSAYADRPLPIGSGQTISAPHMVAIMTDLLSLEPGHSVLEIGTGCGYHAAVTAEVVGADSVYSVEYHDSLAETARENLAAAGYAAVGVRVGDGKEGWPANAPYDRAYLTCAPASIPDPVCDQVRTGGIVVAPVGRDRQRLVRLDRRPDGSFDREDHGGVRFVPLK